MCLALFLLLENFHPSPSFSFLRFLLIIIIIKCVPECAQYPSKCNEAMLGTELNKAAVGLTFRSSQYKCELPQAGGESHGGPGSPPASWSAVGSVSPGSQTRGEDSAPPAQALAGYPACVHLPDLLLALCHSGITWVSL